MACSKCRKKTRMPSKTVWAYEGEDVDGTEDDSLYRMQARMYFEVGESGVRFLPGERVNVGGTLLCQLLNTDPTLFIFLSASEKNSFVQAHPSLKGAV